MNLLDVREIRHFHICCGSGGGAKGFNQGEARLGNMLAKFRCIGGVDVDPAAILDFNRLAGVPGTVLDLFDRDQYLAFHGREPPRGWREATAEDMRQAAGDERPHIVFTSMPCKGFSGLLNEQASKTPKYQALNRLTLRGIWLMLEAWQDDPPELILFENVPRIAKRGRKLLDRIVALLRSYGYATAETTHDCGELGGLAQTRKRFLLVARHQEKVPPFMYEPVKSRLRGVGEVLDRFPLPGDELAGPMHRIPRLNWKTWVRLAFVQAGKDWRSLDRLKVEDGCLRDYALAQAYHNGVLGVTRWEDPACTVSGRGTPTNGAYSVADPRPDFVHAYAQYGVKRWDETSNTIGGQQTPGQGWYSVADPRLDGEGRRYNNVYRVVRWEECSPSVTGGTGPTAGGVGVADPRCSDGWKPRNTLGVREWGNHSHTITGQSRTNTGAFAVADPRPEFCKEGKASYLTAGHYGVLGWDQTSRAVTGSGQHDNGFGAVADPRPLPDPNDQLVARIIAEDGTWHRPFTTLELAGLQGLVDPEEHLILAGLSDSAWRERIGNAVPAPAAQAIAGVMGNVLLRAWSGEGFMLSMEPIWVQPIMAALQLARGADEELI